MSQLSTLLDDSDLEDELFLIELAQQITPKANDESPMGPCTVSQQQKQLTTILYNIIRLFIDRNSIQSLNARIDSQLNQVREFLNQVFALSIKQPIVEKWIM